MPLDPKDCEHAVGFFQDWDNAHLMDKNEEDLFEEFPLEAVPFNYCPYCGISFKGGSSHGLSEELDEPSERDNRANSAEARGFSRRPDDNGSRLD